MGGAGEAGFCVDRRTNGPPKDDLHNSLVKMRKNELLPEWFDQEAQNACMDVAMNDQTDSYIGYLVTFQEIEEEYGDVTIANKMRAVGAHAMGREYRFDDAAVTPDVLQIMYNHQKQNLARQGVLVLPPRPGKGGMQSQDEGTAAIQDRLAHYMADYKSVAHKMSLDQYMALLSEHRFSSIKDIGY